MSVLKLPLLVDLQQKEGELVLSITSCPSVIILENALKLMYKNVVILTFTTGIMFLLFTCVHFWWWEFYEGVVRVCADRL
jgi:hypothetical protein